MKGDHAAAVEDCQQALQLKPDYANAYNNLGNIYKRSGDLQRALENYSGAIAIAPGDPLIYNNRAALHFALKQYDKALEDLQQCQTLGGTPHAGLVQAVLEAIKDRQQENK